MKLHRIFTTLFILFLVILAASVPAIVVQAAPAFPQEAQPPAPVDIDALVSSLPGLAGVAALITLLVNVGKRFGLVKDGQAPTWSAGLNLLALIGLFIAQVTGYTNLIPIIDEQAGSLALALSAVLAFVFQLFASRIAHDNALAGAPLIGTSHSGRQAGESVTTIETEISQFNGVG